MNARGAMMLCAVFGIIPTTVACLTGRMKDHSPPIMREASPAPRQMATKQQTLTDQPIRSVDFANFTYPWVSDLGDPKKGFALQRGEFPGNDDEMPITMRTIAQGDVTGDKVEEAIIVLSVVVSGGTARPHVVYIYTIQDERPSLLWAFVTGDRADGGLRQVYADNGQLVIERYGKDGIVGDCCPNIFFRTRYEWRNNRFQQKGTQETLSNSEGHGWPIMPFYHSMN